MTQAELDALKALANAATPGPWGHWLHQVGGADWRGQWYLLADVYGSDNMGDEAAKNAAFIAASRAAVPALLAEVERLRAFVPVVDDFRVHVA